jgi:hypothetical protein
MSCKTYVPVTAAFDADGNIIPLDITWEDGRRYEIDRVLDVRRAASLRGGGLGMRYTCRIGGRVTYIWLDERRWFVERREDSDKIIICSPAL